MTRSGAVSAVYDLPHHVWVSPEVLGTSTPTGHDLLRFEVLTPAAVPGAHAGVVTPPDLPGVPPDHEIVGRKPWVMDFAAFTDAPATALCRVGLVATLEANTTLPQQHWQSGDLAERVRDALGDHVEGWFDHLRSWVEVATGQDLDFRHPSYDAKLHGAGLHVWERSGFSPPRRVTLTTPHVQPLPLWAWKGILGRLGTGEEPPGEYLLLRDARAALARGETRRAVLDAATAAEIVLNGALEDVLGGLPVAVKAAVLKEPRTLGRLVELLDRAGADLGTDRKDLLQLTHARNQAAHRGVALPYDAALAVLEVSNRVVGSLGSLRLRPNPP